jgi:DNA-binding GntR family transcriptional regulator
MGEHDAPVLDPDEIREMLDKNPFEKISNIVFHMMEDAILSYRLRPLEKLNVTKIASSLHISVTPVREAIEQLRQKGLVTVEQKGDGKYCNYYVFDMSENDIEDLFQVRKAIESSSAYLCAQRNWRVDIGELGRLAEQFQKGLRDVVDGHPSNSGVKTMELDRGFHNILVRDSGNPHFMEMYESLGKLLDYLSLRTNEFLAVERDEDKLMLLGSQHIAIYKAVKNGYPRLASDTMNEHIDLCSNSCLRNRNLVSKR